MRRITTILRSYPRVTNLPPTITLLDNLLFIWVFTAAHLYLQSILDMLKVLLFTTHNNARAIVIIIKNINPCRPPLTRV